VAEAVARLASGSPKPVNPNDPLAGAFGEAAAVIDERIRSRLREQKEEVEAEVKREIVRVRSQCERLVEKYAERAHAEKKETRSALDSLNIRREQDVRRWEIERQLEEERLHQAEDKARELADKVAEIESELAHRISENTKLRTETEWLLKEVERLKDQGVKFFDKVAAQLRVPLQLVGKMAEELAEKEPETEEGKAPSPEAAEADDDTEHVSAGLIRRRLFELERLVEQVLDLSKVESSSLTLVYAEVHPHKFVKKCLAEVEARARAASLQLSSSVSDKLPPVVTDVRLVTRILRQLLSNAVQFTPRGGRVSVTAEILQGEPPITLPRQEGDSGEFLRLEVKDTGPGIAKEDRARIFQAFERGANPQFTLRDAKAGLGLTLARGYARLLGGEIALETEVGQGSTFSLMLPVKVCAVTSY
jgi:signal transduction histidine kinase